MKLSRVLILAIAAVILVAVAIVSIYLYVAAFEHKLAVELASQVPVPVGPIRGSASISGSGILSYNNSRYYTEYAIVNYGYHNATRLNLSLRMYGSDPISNIYLIDTGYSCFKCINEVSIYQGLLKYLGTYGLLHNSSSLSYVNISQVTSLPPNSTLIIPSGLMPSSLLPFSGSPSDQAATDIIALMARGDTIVYVGYNFSRSIENGINYISSAQTIAALDSARLNTTRESSPVQANGFYLQYPTYSFPNGSVYGPAAYTHVGNGTIVTLGNYPDVGWSNASLLAHDIALALHLRFWMPLVSESAIENATSLSGTSTLFSLKVPLPNTNQTNALVNGSYSILTLQVSNQSAFVTKEIPFRLRFENNGTLGIPGVIGEGQSVPVSIYVGNKGNGLRNITVGNFSRNALLFHIVVYNSTLGYIYSLPIGFFNTSLGVVIYSSFTFKPGYYIASLQDINSRVYENALFYLPHFRITPSYADFKNGTFLFNVINNNQSVSGIPFTAEINGANNQSGEITGGVLNYSLPKGTVIPYGNQTLSLGILGVNYPFYAYYPRPVTGGIPPLYIEFGIAAFAILLLNLIAKAPNKDEYFIDVPVFHPSDKFEVKTSSVSILNLFGTLNDRFGWKYMPLTAEEIKMGISSNIRYKNMPIMITTANASEILYSLAEADKVEAAPPYFMPKKWESESHHNIEYLVMFRRLRDFAVKNAMLFTELDEGAAADMITTFKGKQSHLYLYSKLSGIRDFTIVPGSRTFMVFSDSETRAQFLDRLYVTYGAQAEKLRICISGASITLIDTENLEQLLY